MKLLLEYFYYLLHLVLTVYYFGLENNINIDNKIIIIIIHSASSGRSRKFFTPRHAWGVDSIYKAPCREDGWNQTKCNYKRVILVIKIPPEVTEKRWTVGPPLLVMNIIWSISCGAASPGYQKFNLYKLMKWKYWPRCSNIFNNFMPRRLRSWYSPPRNNFAEV